MKVVRYKVRFRTENFWYRNALIQTYKRRLLEIVTELLIVG